MNTYVIQYSGEGPWIPLSIKARSIYEALNWARANLPGGLCVSLFEEWPEETNVDLW